MTFEIALDGKEYVCTAWETKRVGEAPSLSWTRGLLGGMGHDQLDSLDSYLMAQGMDVSTPPYVRLAPAVAASLSDADIDPTFPVYAFRAQDASANAYVYILNGRYGYKWKLSDNSTTVVDFAANSVCGQPVQFEGEWCVPLGATNQAQRLDVIGVSAGAAHGDTWTNMGAAFIALHFGVASDGGVAKLLAAKSPNLVALSADGVLLADTFEVGDSGYTITGVLSGNGAEATIIKQDGPWRFEAEGGKAVRAAILAGSNLNIGTYEGSNSHQFGPFVYCPYKGGLKRIFGDLSDDTGFEADPAWISRTLDSYNVFDADSFWLSVTGWGRWVYGSISGAAKGAMFVGYIIGESGLIHWLGPYAALGSSLSRSVVTAGADSPILWKVDGGSIQRIALAQDGSLRTALGGTRGAASTTYRLFLSSWVPAEGKNVQVRRLWAITEHTSAGWGSNNPLQLILFRNGAVTSDDVGATINAVGFFERVPTAGSDLARELRMGLEVVSDAAVTADPRIRAWGIDCMPPSYYRVALELRGKGRGLREALDALRDMRGGDAIAVREPGMNSTYQGYVTDVREKAVELPTGAVGYDVELELERYDYSYAA